MSSNYSSPHPSSAAQRHYNTASYDDHDDDSSYVLNAAMDASPIRQGSTPSKAGTARENSMSMPLPIDDPMEDPDSPYRHNRKERNDEGGPLMTKEELEAQIRALVMSPSGTSLMDVLVKREEGEEGGMYHPHRGSATTFTQNSGPTTRDYFGATDRMYGGGKGQVTIQDQVTEAENEVVLIDLPPSLSVLYAAGFASQNKSSVVNLLAMLSGIAYIREQDNYREINTQHRQENDACYRLHIRSKESADRLAAIREKLYKDRIDEEMSECTFSPNPLIWAQDDKRIKAERLALNQKGRKGVGKQQKHNNVPSASGGATGEGGDGDEDTKAAEAAMEGKTAEEEEEAEQQERKKRSNEEFVSSVYEWAKGREKKHAANVEKYKNEFQDSVEETRVSLSKRTEYLAKKHRQKQAEENNAVALLAKFDNSKRAAFAAVTCSMKKKNSHINHDDNGSDNNSEVTLTRGQQGADEDDAATKVRSLLELGDQQSPTSHRRTVTCRRSVLDEVTDSYYYPSFAPVTNSMAKREDMFMKYLQYEAAMEDDEEDKEDQDSSSSEEDGDDDEHQQGENREDGDGEKSSKKKKKSKKSEGGNDEEGNSSSSHPPHHPKKKSQFFYDPAVIDETLWAGKADTAKTVKRLVDDVEQRKVRQALRLEDDKLRQRELMYDPQTGQPLFQPNSMPTVLINKKRIPIDELPPSDRAEAMKILRQKHLDFLHETATRKKESGTTRDLAGFFQHCSELQNKAQKRVEKIRKLEEKELTGLFVPKIDPQSAMIIESRGREKVHKRELPVKEKPPTPPRKKESDAERIFSMLERSKTWEQRRSTKLGRREKELSKEEIKECTFSPKTQKSKTDRLAAAAEARVASEMAVMRSQSEQLAQMQAASLARQQSIRRGNGSQHSSVSRHSATGGAYAPHQEGPQPASSQRNSLTVPSDIIPTTNSFLGRRSHNNNDENAAVALPPFPTNSAHHHQYSSSSRGASNVSQYAMGAQHHDEAAAASSYPTLEELSREEHHHTVSGNVGGVYPPATSTPQYITSSSPSRHQSRNSMHSSNRGGEAHRVVSSRSHAESNGSVDKLIGSWNELDSITDAVLGKLDASR